MTEPASPAFHSRVMSLWWGMRLFEIPVYRVSPEQWRREQTDREERFFACAPVRDLPLTDKQKWRIRDALRGQRGGYHHNEIMGWVQVVWDGPGPVIKCYHQRVAVRRVTRTFRQQRFGDVGKVAELWFDRAATSAEIAADIRNALLAESSGRGSLAGRFLDLECFDALAPVLDLRGLLRLDQNT